VKDKLNVMPFPAGAMHNGMGGNGRGRERERERERERYIKCFCQQFSDFNRKKDQNRRFEGGGRGHGVHGRDGGECM